MLLITYYQPGRQPELAFIIRRNHGGSKLHETKKCCFSKVLIESLSQKTRSSGGRAFMGPGKPGQHGLPQGAWQRLQLCVPVLLSSSFTCLCEAPPCSASVGIFLTTVTLLTVTQSHKCKHAYKVRSGPRYSLPEGQVTQKKT